MARQDVGVREAVRVATCDTEGLVRVSEAFAELELEMVRRTELTAAQVAAERADWAAVGTAMGRVYQALCDEDNEGALNALRAIETILTKRGVLVPRPTIHERPAATPAAGRAEGGAPETGGEGEVRDGE